MKLCLYITHFLFSFCLFTNVTGQQRFECNGKLLIATSDGTTTSIYQPTFIPFSIPFLSILAKYDGSFDAMGFNPKDNFVYSVEQNTNYIVRHSLYTTFERIGRASIVDTLKVNAGDCTADGYYVCYDYALNKMLVFDVTDQFRLVRQISLFWDEASPNKGEFKARLYDFAFDPNEIGIAYSYQARFENQESGPVPTKGALLKINLNFNDPNLGMVTPMGQIKAEEVTHIGGLVFNPQSMLFGFGSSLTGQNPLQNYLFSINAFQGQIAPVLTNSPAQVLSDGCSCPFSLSFTNIAPNEGMYCSNDTKTFVVAFENNSYIPLTDIVLKDTFPEGTIINLVSNTFTGKIDDGTGKGTNILSISGLTIPAKGKVVIKIEVTSIDAKDGTTFNQAFLHNLPPNFPVSVASDDPTSSPSGDRSNFHFITRGIHTLKWQTRSPSDCIRANDGKIVVTAPEFIIGQTYEVSLRNRIGWTESSSLVVIDEKNSFTIDSLIPGEYQLFRFRSLSDNCSVSLKDTTILLDAPNHLLEFSLTSNSPVCEGASLLLNGSMSLDGSILWRGPDIFGSEALKPEIKNVNSAKSGKYEAVATYGYCNQKKFQDVEVKPQIKSYIEGDSNYCIRDTLQLFAKTKEEEAVFSWFGPNNLIDTDAILNFPIVSGQQSGAYKVISTNGACFDTSVINVTVLPTPSLALDDFIITDYCDPLILFPKLLSDEEVNYRWLPQDGLSCTDCPNPQINPIVKSEYQLCVKNEHLCSDSATTKIILDKEKIINVPNIISPESSRVNSLFKILPSCVVRYIHQFDIYDRSGNRIFSTGASNASDQLDEWNGNTSGKSVSSGVFVWLAKVELVDGSVVYLTGDVTVL